MGKYHEDLALRLLDIKFINDEWKDLTKKYGAEVATEFKKLLQVTHQFYMTYPQSAS